MNEQPQKLDTHFIKNADFKTVLGSGFYGGFTPSGHLNVFVYTDRVPIPTKISFQVDPSSAEVLGEIDRETKVGIVREVQFGVLFDIETAEGLMHWLKGKLEDYHNAKTASTQ